jgi:DNA invertase Pin-like site-specific DNA recombinase
MSHPDREESASWRRARAHRVPLTHRKYRHHHFGRLVFNIFGSLAQFERDLIRERTHAGLKAPRERGNKGGRRPVVTPDKLQARAHIAAGLTVREAAARLKIGKTAYSRL